MVRIWSRLVALGALISIAVLSGCSGEEAARDELLLAYSGDCQAYIEPCG